MSDHELIRRARAINDLFQSDRALQYKPGMKPKGDDGKVAPEAENRTDFIPSEQDFIDHLTGKLGMGLFVKNRDGKCGYMALDHDFYSPGCAIAVARQVAAIRLPAVVCRTKSNGARILFFFDEPQPWEKVEVALRAVAARLDMKIKGVHEEGDTEIISGNIWLPYLSGTACPAIDYTMRARLDGRELSLDEFLIQARNVSMNKHVFEFARRRAGCRGRAA